MLVIMLHIVISHDISFAVPSATLAMLPLQVWGRPGPACCGTRRLDSITAYAGRTNAVGLKQTARVTVSCGIFNVKNSS